LAATARFTFPGCTTRTSSQGGLWNGKWGDDSQIFPDNNTSRTDPAYPEFSPGIAAPALAADPHNGTLYVAFANGNQNLGVLRSTDFGASWRFMDLDVTATTAAGGYDSNTGTFHIPYVAAADVDPADAAAVSVRAVVQWELGEREPGWFNILALVDALEVSTEAFRQEATPAPAPRRGRPRTAAPERQAPKQPRGRPRKGG
jgi:hypothetical protein